MSGATGNGNGNRGGNGQANVSGVPQARAQANLGSATTISGTVSAYNYGTLTVQTADGQAVGVQLGNSTYNDSLGFAPQIGQGVAVYGFTGDQGLFSAITVTLDNGQVYTFREATGRPAWAGGNGKGGGNH